MDDLMNGIHALRLPVPETAAQPRLLAFATAVPPYRLDQAQARARVGRLFAGSGSLDRVSAVFERAGVETRYSGVPAEWHDEPHGWAQRNKLYVDNALMLLEKVTRDCLDQANLAPSNLDAIVVVSTTGISTPSLDALLMERLSLRRDMQRLPIFGLGCTGGVLGLARAASLARALPASRVLFLVVELCTLCFRSNDRPKTNFVVAALFGDGAAGAIISSHGEDRASARPTGHARRHGLAGRERRAPGAALARCSGTGARRPARRCGGLPAAQRTLLGRHRFVRLPSRGREGADGPGARLRTLRRQSRGGAPDSARLRQHVSGDGSLRAPSGAAPGRAGACSSPRSARASAPAFSSESR